MRIWPELEKLIKEAGISDYSIYLDQRTNTLFATLKLREDHASGQLPDNPVQRKWWEYMSDIMDTNPDKSPWRRHAAGDVPHGLGFVVKGLARRHSERGGESPPNRRESFAALRMTAQLGVTARLGVTAGLRMTAGSAGRGHGLA